MTSAVNKMLRANDLMESSSVSRFSLTREPATKVKIRSEFVKAQILFYKIVMWSLEN